VSFILLLYDECTGDYYLYGRFNSLESAEKAAGNSDRYQIIEGIVVKQFDATQYEDELDLDCNTDDYWDRIYEEELRNGNFN
jgi:hypothetical protein